MKIKDLPKIERPREKLIAQGQENLKDKELLAILLGTGIEGKNVIELAEQIFKKYPIKDFLSLRYQDLVEIKGINSAKACIILASQELVKRGLELRDESLPKISSAEDVLAQVSYLRDKTREHLAVLFLNARNELLFKKSMFIGTLNESLVHPREIFQEALKQNACSVILAHNHPSGNNEPSEDDLQITKRIKEAGKIMGIEVLDHIIVAKGKTPYSLKQYNLI
ncbi:MAG: hypothetical protein A2360_01415 [Candidatus Staskawiczbacteria bacterium RIFOXYB1_FULL_32_11]|uniref:MPN domain-containing protein n=1 Tax=Candidatus Staskawiczbacteria bacterium RIFOXYD1_FULL_32_13 TaxID=1802234 RepID=A0A1G2JMX9_9BACT|nr:MAG: repair protein RadC protein [Parcubacteria group bacterium GW2011_GWC2_32_10]OGZ77147.1 MAG: hypothetical protein A2256_00470 [Candidatus Staskawiczbacteria bacterium RIFOXYA2_FULL_32_7]OGZ78221.1 MAG: hypothetical protein A2360_01415 [Candidatus Staskawiczbacteria bacterium RIFOXYB1_FULL_32_11]OGZ85910.1 MAG: hypothetical protein A2463_02160 [Candidatus Staskawiczbacteria bacterium RIFOXYC2_FULL_32_10]OGZ87598.1 MAG: hypothetical protein A2561_03975 [Candidatus Staskawiczbacteria bacte